MKVILNGRSSVTHGKQPKKPVRWSGKFLVVDKQGNALEAAWQPNGGGLMNYMDAREAARNLIDEMAGQLFETHKNPIKKVAFTLMSR